MSREQWGNGYWQGYEDGLLDRKRMSIDDLADAILFQLSQIPSMSNHISISALKCFSPIPNETIDKVLMYMENKKDDRILVYDGEEYGDYVILPYGSKRTYEMVKDKFLKRRVMKNDRKYFYCL